MSIAQQQLRSLIDRVLRLKEEQDALSADIREVYAEAKANGFDKTAMGRVVAHLRNVEKKGQDAVNEQGAVFDVYLHSYLGTDVATHAHEAESDALPPHDPETGEITIIDECDDRARLRVTVDRGVADALGEAVETVGAAPDAPKPEPDNYDHLEIPPFLRRTG